MRAVRCLAWGGIDDLVIEDVPVPTLGAGEVRVAIRAAGLNFADTLIIAGKYQEKPALPFSPGFEAGGVVLEVGGGVTSVKPGDRVMAVLNHGGFAEEAVLRAEDVFPIPDAMDFVTAAAFPIAYGTSHIALWERARLKAGEVLLVHGAAGGVGLTAVEIGKAMGATVIATAGGAAKLEVAKAHGADHLIDYQAEDIRERVKELTGGRGADVVYDPVGGDVFDASLRCTAWSGRLLAVGFAAGRVPQVPANILLVKNLAVLGIYWGSYRTHAPELVAESFRTLFGWTVEGKLKPHVSHTLPLAEFKDALRLLAERKSTGKVVLTVAPP
ncbi:MAG TPA: NADPH:quinone oxidoreductase family protein [Azospirillaceae bacterium]|nr:NADPH:quinone oxidoreductase family protein [Azospirillaceae bacterium]